MREEFDFAVIGGGSAGLTASIMAARLGARTLLVDRESLGGDCLNYGCVPSKALIASARAAHQMRRAEDFGIDGVDVLVDSRSVLDRMRRIRARIGETDSPEALAMHGLEVALGGARFTDRTEILIGNERRVRAKRYLIATGSRPAIPLIPGIETVDALTNEGLFDLEELPPSMVIIGGGPIGCEMAQALARLGVAVTLVVRGPRLLEREEPEVSELIQQVFEAEGITIHQGVGVDSVGRTDAGCFVALESERVVVASRVMLATGRVPNLDSLDLPHAGIPTTARGIEVGKDLRTHNRAVYAAGDCTGGPQFTHWAEYEARIATRNALFRGRQLRDPEVVPWTTFTDPEVARVGLTLAQARKRDPEAHVHELALSHVDRAVCEGTPAGFLRAVVGRRDRVLGVHLVGAHAGELLPTWTEAVGAGRKLNDVSRTIHVYPTLSHGSRRLSDESFMAHGVGRLTSLLFARFRSRTTDSVE